ncbi:hypothetical protein B0A48_04243 [Cryoendolithus antarcticus]|uniref:Uncharacterized protein n=1 Tax=Cryoendolithus antarcticus TaxID=1507870 RepID=A0A1V8TET3_9PEZI|nr:hypothetical protein B0A48_04243 [Cryoendolithus antarcticus]
MPHADKPPHTPILVQVSEDKATVSQQSDEMAITSVQEFRFLDLLPELRFMVYELHLADSAYTVVSGRVDLSSSSLGLVCRTIAVEYLPVYQRYVRSKPQISEVDATVSDFDFRRLQSLLRYRKQCMPTTGSLSLPSDQNIAQNLHLKLNITLIFSRYTRTDHMNGVEDTRRKRLADWLSACKREYDEYNPTYSVCFQTSSAKSRKSCFRCLISSLYSKMLGQCIRHNVTSRLKIRYVFDRAAVVLIMDESGLASVPGGLEFSPMLVLERLFAANDKWKWKCGVCDMRTHEWMKGRWSPEPPAPVSRGNISWT